MRHPERIFFVRATVRRAALLPADQFSFPSGHTMTAFAVAVALSLFYEYRYISLSHGFY